ncbi:hypothetical protein ACF0H5_018326 [Mactra antiquata]
MWERVCEVFNKEAVTKRSKIELSKKWDNLVQTHRPKYLEYKRQMNQTGLGRTTVTISELTESVLDTIGKDSVSVNGVEAKDCLDSAYIQLSCINENSDTVGLEGVDQVIQIVDKVGEYQPLTCPDVKTQHCCKCAECTAIRGLKRKKTRIRNCNLGEKTKSC